MPAAEPRSEDLGARPAAAVEPAAPEPAPATPAEPAPRRLAGPTLEDAPVAPAPRRRASSELSRQALVESFEVALYSRPGGGARIGLARLGSVLPAEPTGRHCSGGEWLQVSGDAYACAGDGLRLTEGEASEAGVPGPMRQELLPYEYVRAARKAPRLSSMPRDDSDQALRSVVERWMTGQHFLAIWRRVSRGTSEYYETIRGNFVRVEDVSVEPLRAMHGELLADEVSLPLAFALDDAELLCVNGNAVEPCGTADKHARFPVAERRELDGVAYAVGDDGIALPVDAVRIIDKVERPEDVPDDARWIHIDLSQQALIAYEGDRPVYATLVSTGKPGHDTENGLFQVERRYVSKTMRGQDEDGFYEVQEVPWTMYYDGNFAVHGAYWHDLFGRTKSHGCVNVPPADARWLYFWSASSLARGWHAVFDDDKTWVYITGTTPPAEDPS